MEKRFLPTIAGKVCVYFWWDRDWVTGIVDFEKDCERSTFALSKREYPMARERLASGKQDRRGLAQATIQSTARKPMKEAE